MGTISAVSSAGAALRRNPIIFAAMVVVVGVSLLSTVVQFLPIANDPLVSSLLSMAISLVVTVFVYPFVEGGIIGMAHEGVVGRTGFGTFLSEGRENYVGLLLANILLFAIFIATGIVYLIVSVVIALVAGFAVGGGGGGGFAGGVGLGAGLVFTGISALLIIGLLLVPFFLQFYQAAIVVDDAGVTDSFRRSAGLVRANFAKTLGYNVIALLVNLVSVIPILYYVVTQVSVSDAPANAAANGFLGTSPSGGLVFFVAWGVLSFLIGAFLRTYYVAYYTDRTEGRPEPTA
ncbi:DUF7847 domain-containing protein [Halococcus hamelinensis]|uniref:DUF7847 domain-containing protein n=1 Tax=Halococcus hamelinensis 100A6 TaxID=1132509 RepID=M0MA07_9EURY|nr:hypothetical protein [Halococcus hamelinensis]EMA41459.1 hypothetical protein C447_01355 [Halococcus hamelinensis 100A6]